MDITLTLDDHRHRVTVTAEPGEYDGRVLFPSIHISALPLSLHADRAAVAASLLFHDRIAGALRFDKNCSPQVASALRNFFAPVDVHVLSVDFAPSRTGGGEGTLFVVAEGVNDGVLVAPDGNDVLFRVVKEGAGFLATRNSFTVVSNAAVTPSSKQPPLARILPSLGVAVLFAEDLFAGRIIMPGVDGVSDASSWARLRMLLDAAGLQLLPDAVMAG